MHHLGSGVVCGDGNWTTTTVARGPCSYFWDDENGSAVGFRSGVIKVPLLATYLHGNMAFKNLTLSILESVTTANTDNFILMSTYLYQRLPPTTTTGNNTINNDYEDGKGNEGWELVYNRLNSQLPLLYHVTGATASFPMSLTCPFPPPPPPAPPVARRY
jgi:hypothetical protein